MARERVAQSSSRDSAPGRQLSRHPRPRLLAACAAPHVAPAASFRAAAMSGEVIDLTRVDEDADAAAARRAAKRARRAGAAAAAAAVADVIDLSREEDPAAAACGGVGAVRAPFTCGICLCDCAPAEGHALFCGHVYCRECLGGHCAAQVGDGLPSAAGVPCPEPQCRKPLSGADVAAVTDAATAARFEALALEKLVQSNRDSMGCVAQNDNGALDRSSEPVCAGAARRPAARSYSRGIPPTASCSVRSATRRTASNAR
jgi:hypothetical protein